MTEVDLNQAAGRVASRMLEEAAFIFTEPWEDAPAFEGDLETASIDYEGPKGGTVAIAAEPAFCTALAANFLGLEPDDPDAARKGQAALCEVLNIITGALMEELFGTDEVCHIGIPCHRLENRDKFAASFAGTSPLIFQDDQGYRIELIVTQNQS